MFVVVSQPNTKGKCLYYCYCTEHCSLETYLNDKRQQLTSKGTANGRNKQTVKENISLVWLDGVVVSVSDS